MAIPYTVGEFAVKIWEILITQAFPSECLHCSTEGPWLCAACTNESTRILKLTCPGCNRLSSRGATCSRCKNSTPLTGLLSLYYYREPIVSYIHRFKYEKVWKAHEHFVGDIANLIKNNSRLTKNSLLTSVPLSKQKLTERGFNQSELIAMATAKQLNLPYKNLLGRANQTTSQTKLSRKQRLENVANQFSVINTPEVDDKNIILFDDVFTTGATSSSCARVLKAAGARSVWCVTIAKD